MSVPITVRQREPAPQITFIANQTVARRRTLDAAGSGDRPRRRPDGSQPADLGLPAFATFVDNGNGTGTFTFAPGLDDAATTRSP